MSIITAVFLPEGIILAGDSRLTGYTEFVENETRIRTEFTFSDNMQKIILLNKMPVGIAFCGNAMINGGTVAQYIGKFEIEKVESKDTVKDIAEKLCDYTKGLGMSFFVGGYNSDTPYIYKVDDRSEIVNVSNSEFFYGATWGGRIEAAERLIRTEPYMTINWGLMPLKDGLDFAEFIVSTTINYERFKSDIQKCGGPIDILIINRDKAFWYKHKIFKP